MGFDGFRAWRAYKNIYKCSVRALLDSSICSIAGKRYVCERLYSSYVKNEEKNQVDNLLNDLNDWIMEKLNEGNVFVTLELMYAFSVTNNIPLQLDTYGTLCGKGLYDVKSDYKERGIWTQAEIYYNFLRQKTNWPELKNEALEIMTVLSDYVEENTFSIDEFKLVPNYSGCFLRCGKWFVYITDEHVVCTINGPYDVHGVICAALKKLHIKNTCYQWKTENDRSTYLNNHFRSLEEVDEYMASYEKKED